MQLSKRSEVSFSDLKTTVTYQNHERKWDIYFKMLEIQLIYSAEKYDEHSCFTSSSNQILFRVGK